MAATVDADAIRADADLRLKRCLQLYPSASVLQHGRYDRVRRDLLPCRRSPAAFKVVA